MREYSQYVWNDGPTVEEGVAEFEDAVNSMDGLTAYSPFRDSTNVSSADGNFPAKIFKLADEYNLTTVNYVTSYSDGRASISFRK